MLYNTFNNALILVESSKYDLGNDEYKALKDFDFLLTRDEMISRYYQELNQDSKALFIILEMTDRCNFSCECFNDFI